MSSQTRIRIPSELEEHRIRLRGDSFGRLVGRARPMLRAFRLLRAAAKSDATVLLEGETGTGKEEAAEAIHRASARAAGPFVVVDCSALTGEMLHSELFGHTRGSFTGAVGSRAGAFQAANGGTLFLDEIGELPLDLQPKLLRALEARKVKRLGSNEYEAVDVRVVAATNRELRGEVEEKRFRSDLYYRLAVLAVRLPALRERPEDLELIAGKLLERLGASEEQAHVLLAHEALEQMAGYAWPGNVRELRNYLERSLAMGEAAELASEPAAAAPPVDTNLPLKQARAQWVGEFERQYIEQLLDEHDGYVRSAAKQAGIDRVSLYRLMSRHGVRPKSDAA